MQLDPQIQRLLHMLALGGAGPATPPGVAQRRAAFAALMRLGAADGGLAEAADRVLPGPAGALPIRCYSPPDPAPGDLPGLVFLHGGGFCCGDLDTHDALCRSLCAASGCRVIAVDYRLAPEHPCPAALQDAYAATLWVLDHARELAIDPRRIGIAGDSAGATLAAVTCRSVSHRRPGALALQLLLCPILDWAGETESRRAFAEGYLLDRAGLAQDLACYLPPGEDPAQPHVSPLRAADLAGLPPAHIHTAAFDPLRDDGAAYAAALRAAGVAVRHTCHAGMIHLFYGFGRLVPYARAALERIGAEAGATLAPAAVA